MLAGYSVGNLTDLRNISPNRRTNTALRFVLQKREWYVFNATSIAADDNDRTIAPAEGSGRWEAVRPTVGSGTGGSGSELQLLQDQLDALNIDVYAPDFGLLDRVTNLENSSSSDLADRVNTIEFQLNGSEGDGLVYQVDQLDTQVSSLATNLPNQFQTALELLFIRTRKHEETFFSGSGSKTLWVAGFSGVGHEQERIHVAVQQKPQLTSFTIEYFNIYTPIELEQIPSDIRDFSINRYARIDFQHSADITMTVFVDRYLDPSALIQNIFNGL